MQKGFAQGAMAAISALYNLPEKYTLKCDQTGKVLEEWGPNKVVVNKIPEPDIEFEPEMIKNADFTPNRRCMKVTKGTFKDMIRDCNYLL
jgi:hypothetical protein